MKTFYSYSFGCRVNEAEKQEIDRKMIKKGFIFNSKKPDIFIINTCSVTNKAEREARQLIYQAKKAYPKAKIVITGCSATYWLKNNLFKNLSIDMLIDNKNKDYLVDLIIKRLIKKTKKIEKPNLTTNSLSNKFINSSRALIKIQDGCQRFCSFCIVPYLRGLPKSESIDNLVKKIKDLEKSDIKEVILTAINTQAYGFDTKEEFIDLIRSVIDKTKIPRISFGSIHPWSLNDNFFSFYKNYLPKQRIINYFHIPLQSGSNKILSLMKRGYTREEMLEKIIKIKKINPYAFIGTDVIVGFLEETEKDFKDTYNFLEKAPIDKFHVFRFSKRSKTAADYMAKRLYEPTSMNKIKRSQVLIKLSEKKYQEFNIKNIGRTSSVLILEKTLKGYREGLLDNQLPIWIADKNLQAGEIKNVYVVGYKNNKLFGKIV